MTIPPLVDPDALTPEVIEDIKDASARFYTLYGYTDAYDWLMTRDENRVRVEAIAAGGEGGTEAIRFIIDGLLRPWHSVRNFPAEAFAGAAAALRNVQERLARLPASLTLELATDDNLGTMADAFGEFASTPYFGGTNASKTLSLLRPGLFMMWDKPIADAYQFHICMGYAKFLRRMRQGAVKIRELWLGPEALEEYLKPAGRAYRPTLAKYLDEWNWLRITKGVRRVS